MVKVITVTDMVRSLSDIIGRVHYKHETFSIKKGVKIVATLAPAQNKSTIAMKDLNDFFSKGPRLDEEDIDHFQKDVGALRLLRDNGGFSKWD
jgi:hypothetical protein